MQCWSSWKGPSPLSPAGLSRRRIDLRGMGLGQEGDGEQSLFGEGEVEIGAARGPEPPAGGLRRVARRGHLGHVGLHGAGHFGRGVPRDGDEQRLAVGRSAGGRQVRTDLVAGLARPLLGDTV